MEEARSAEVSQRHPLASQSSLLWKENGLCNFLHPLKSSHPPGSIDSNTSKLISPASSYTREATSPLSIKIRKDRWREGQ